MAKVDWGKVANTVSGVINDLREERTVTLVKPSESDVNTNKPWLGKSQSSATTFTDVGAVMIPIMKSDQIDSRGKQMVKLFIDGPALGDEQLNEDWTVIDDQTGTEFEIMSVSRTQPGTNVILYTIEALL